MKKLRAIQQYEPPTISEISEFEEKNGIHFPEDYRLFLLTQNLLLCEENTFFHNEEGYEVHHFFPFTDRTDLSLSDAYFCLHDFLEGKYLPIADDSGGWLYVISLQGRDFGKVYFCRMDKDLEEGVTHLANSFEEFVDGLEIWEG